MRFTKLFAAAAFCCATGASLAAGGTFTLTDGAGSFTSVIGANTAFNDVFTFTLPSYAVDTNGLVSSLTIPLNRTYVNGYGDINFSSISLSGGSLTSPLSFVAVTTGVNTQEMYYLSVPQQIAPGNYQINLVGANQSSVSASYTGSINVTAVPEPSGIAAALAGFGVFAALVSRRRHAKSEA